MEGRRLIIIVRMFALLATLLLFEVYWLYGENI